MATETVIYVSLALVLLTRIYVFINPPDFLEEHKDRRYHEYHLYRQYHLHKQSNRDDEDHSSQQQQQQLQDPNYATDSTADGGDQPLLLTPNGIASFQRGHPERKGTRSTSGLETLHNLTDELVLLGMGPGSKPFPLHELSADTLSRLDLAPPSPLSASTSSVPSPATSTSMASPVREREQDLWKQIISSTESKSVPNYLSLDPSEIHYNGSLLEKFDTDPEVQRVIQELRAGQRDMAKECPVMTVVWEGGRWCCLEGRALYILRALEWKGQVRVRVLVDKDPTLLAVTEDCWRAAGMTTLDSTRPTSLRSQQPPSISSEMSSAHQNTVPFASATANTPLAVDETVSLGLSLDEDLDSLTQHSSRDGTRTPSKVRFSVLAAQELHHHQLSQPSLPGSPTGHDADDEKDDDDQDDDGIESDGYMEDNEEDTDDDEDEDEDDENGDLFDEGTSYGSRIHQNMNHHRLLQIDPRPSKPERKGTRVLAIPARPRPSTSSSSSTLVSGISAVTIQDEDENNSDLTAVSPPHSPLLLPLKSEAPMFTKRKIIMTRQYSVSSSSQLNHHHERKISIPEFLLPPPLHHEQEYLILDSALDKRDNPPRRDSGHGDTP